MRYPTCAFLRRALHGAALAAVLAPPGRAAGRAEPLLAQALDAPWSTRELLLIGCYVLSVAAGFIWVLALSWRMRGQAERIKTYAERHAALSAALERSSRFESLGVVAGGIAHDFNNLLTVIMANLGLAGIDARVRALAGHALADAEKGARRAAELTQQLLTFARGGEPVSRAVAMPDVVRESAEFARHGSNVRIDYTFEPNLAPANADRCQIGRVVHNLVLNAVQAMPSGGVVEVKLASVAVPEKPETPLPPGNYVKLSVSDNGPGMTSEQLGKIFEPYFSTKRGNHGLGLATIYSIVKRHRGDIRVDSEPGRGAAFHLWFPAAKPATTGATAVAPRPRATAPLRVLFMDSEEALRRTALTALSEIGHDATVVEDGARALAEYERGLKEGHPYDVVVLDLTVPGGMGAKETIARLRPLDRHARVIVSSGYSQDPAVIRFAEFGFAAAIAKPYKLDDLAQVIQDVALRMALARVERTVAQCGAGAR